MDVRCTSTGKIFYQIESQIAELLIEALPTVFERLEKPEALVRKVGNPHFGIDQSLTGEPLLRYSCDVCSQRGVLFNSHPLGLPGHKAAEFAEQSARSFEWWHCGKRDVVPDAVIEQFKKAFGG